MLSFLFLLYCQNDIKQNWYKLQNATKQDKQVPNTVNVFYLLAKSVENSTDSVAKSASKQPPESCELYILQKRINCQDDAPTKGDIQNHAQNFPFIHIYGV